MSSWLVLVPFEVEIQENWVRPGLTPLFILIGLAAVVFLLGVSMRRQFRRISAPYAADVAAREAEEKSGQANGPQGS